MILLEDNKFGLTLEELELVYGIFRNFPEIKQVNIFGSRAKGNWKMGSDIDLVIMDESVKPEVLRQIKAAFEDSLLPYFVELQLFSELTESTYKSHIERVGKTLYRR